VGLLTILLDNATWCIHNAKDVRQGIRTGANGRFAPMTIPLFDEPGDPGTETTFDPLEGKLLYLAGEVLANGEDGTFEIQIRRNNGSTPIARLTWFDQELGRKSLLMNIPMLVGDFFKLQVIIPSTASVTYSVMVAGKL